MILLGVGRSLESRQPPGFANANIVARGYKIHPPGVRKLDETPQLDALIAPDARIRRCAFEIAGKKVIDDAGAKDLSGVDHLMRNLQYLRDVPGNADFATPTFLPSLGGRDGIVFVFPNLKGDAMDVIALANQKRGGNRAVHSTTHAKKNGRSSHRVAIVLGR